MSEALFREETHRPSASALGDQPHECSASRSGWTRLLWFGRRHVGLPNLNQEFDSDVSLDVMAMRTPGFSGADLANLLNEAAILAGRRGRTAISSKEIDDSIDRIVAGMEGTVMTDGKSKSLVAYHEVGHAICG